MAAHDADVRKATARRGGAARIAKADPEELKATRRAAAAAVNSPAALARRLVKAFPELSRAEQADIRAILTTITDTGPRT